MPEQIEKTIQKLSQGKASGPDEVPNEILQLLGPKIKDSLAATVTNCLYTRKTPATLKETTTVALRKPEKKDYSLVAAYRPITLKNTIAKLIETIVARRLTDAAEKHQLLPWNQMGGRKGRSTITAVRLLIDVIQTV